MLFVATHLSENLPISLANISYHLLSVDFEDFLLPASPLAKWGWGKGNNNDIYLIMK